LLNLSTLVLSGNRDSNAAREGFISKINHRSVSKKKTYNNEHVLYNTVDFVRCFLFVHFFKDGD
jgi:hypothetical protein